jgi:predicted RNase H-like HicB family nuclease
MKYAVLYEKTGNGYSAHVPDLPGCIAAGATLEATRDLIREAIELHLAGMKQDGEQAPAAITEAEYVTVHI